MPIVHHCASANCTTLTMGEFCMQHEGPEAASAPLALADELTHAARAARCGDVPAEVEIDALSVAFSSHQGARIP